MRFIDLIGLTILAIVLVYVLSRIQATAWIHTIERFLNNQKNKQNEQTKKKK